MSIILKSGIKKVGNSQFSYQKQYQYKKWEFPFSYWKQNKQTNKQNKTKQTKKHYSGELHVFTTEKKMID